MSLFTHTTRESHSRARADGHSRTDTAARATLQQAHHPVALQRESLSHSPKVQSQLQLQQLLNGSPRVVAQAKLAAAINTRRHTLQQQQPLQRQDALEDEDLTQRQASLEDEEPLQGKFAVAQREELPEEEEPLQGKLEPVQREAIEDEEEPLQGKFGAIQREASLEDEEPLQSKAEPVQKRENQTGLPDSLKAGVEHLSGQSMDDVRVHYNSAAPATIQALAYTQGTEIHVGPGQEQHLAHEAWHVAQQKQGRVRATRQAKGVALNDDAGLEQEADVMGARASRMNPESKATQLQTAASFSSSRAPIQPKMGFEFETGWDLRKPGGTPWNTDTALVTGKDWQMSPDEINGNNAKIEFKTAPFNVDGTPQAVATPIAAAFESMSKYVNANLLTMDAPAPLKTAITAYRGVQVTPADATLNAKPQVTGGVRTDLILSFLRDLASDEREGRADLMPGAQKKGWLNTVLETVDENVDETSKASREYWGVVALLANLVRRFQNDSRLYSEAIEAWKQEKRGQYNEWLAAEPRTEEAQATVKARILARLTVVQEEKRKEFAPSYAKARASALPRIAFNDLPQVRRGALLNDVLTAAGEGLADRTKRMFPLGLKRDADFPETIEEWIASIQTARGAGEGELWSKRSLGTTPVGPVGRRATGVPFELRGLSGNLPFSDWGTFAIEYVAYFEELNDKALPGNP